MSYEKISAVKVNPSKGVLSFKSHSNNDDAPATWWEANGDTFEDKLVHAYMLHKWGDIRIGSLTGGALALRYAFAKMDNEVNSMLTYPQYEDYATYGEYTHAAQEYFKSVEEMARNGIKMMIEAINEADNDKYIGTFHCYSISSYGNGSFRYGSKEPKKITGKAMFIISQSLRRLTDWRYITFQKVGA